MENFIYDYFVSPIHAHSGYNIVNTLAYALIAIAAVLALHHVLRGRVKFDRRFVAGVLCFVLLGSTVRVVTDSIEGGVFKPVSPVHALVLDSHIYEYPAEGAGILQYWTVSPGIYIAIAAVFVISLAILHRLGRPGLLGAVGLALWLPHFLLLAPFLSYWAYAIPILVLAAIPAALAYRHFKDPVLTAIVAGQALDGAATFFIIDFFGPMTGVRYFEQHVFSAAIGGLVDTFFLFYLVKTGIAAAAALVLSKEGGEVELFKVGGRAVSVDRNYLALVIMIIGFAPGIRDILRMAAGT